MPDKPAASDNRRTPRNWRNREKREKPKYVAKRVSDDEHEVINAYAKSMNVYVSELLAPAVEDLLARARAHQSARAS